MEAWKFLHAAPPHYTTLGLRPHEAITVDGRLDDAAWSAPGVEWTTDMVDITKHTVAAENIVPASLQARAKLRWDASFLYVGVELREPFILANITGHNGPNPPYHDNDVELFVDVSGTTQYYKEFELSARNATYDVLWGVPDGEGLRCSHASEVGAVYPRCVNTSFPGYAGTWTMASGDRASRRGLATATRYATEQYGKFVAPYAVWTAEMAFPLHSSGAGEEAWHGGLLDAGPPYEGGVFTAADPARTRRAGGRPVYWHFDLSRAEHPRKYTPPLSSRAAARPQHTASLRRALIAGRDEEVTAEATADADVVNIADVDGGDGGDASVYCPKGCEGHDLSGWTPNLGALSRAECAAVRARWPTLLGVDPWNCYWEWALADVGTNAYMHRPLYWATLQFADAPADAPPLAAATRNVTCGQLEWPGRYLARLVSVAQRRALSDGGAYTAIPAALLNACNASDGCVAADLNTALSMPDVFEITISLGNDTAPACQLPPPCFAASVRVTPPESSGGAQYAISIDSNSKVATEALASSNLPESACLFTSSHNSLRPAHLPPL